MNSPSVIEFKRLLAVAAKQPATITVYRLSDFYPVHDLLCPYCDDHRRAKFFVIDSAYSVPGGPRAVCKKHADYWVNNWLEGEGPQVIDDLDDQGAEVVRRFRARES